jgi:general secretion pathway protein D
VAGLRVGRYRVLRRHELRLGGNNIINLSAGLGRGEEGSRLLPGRGLNLGYVGGTTSLLGIEMLEIGGLARALASDSNTNVLSTPSIVTLDNHEASINVGQEVPFLSGSYSTQGVSTGEGQVNPFQTINREEIGVKLNVTPHINEGDTIMLNIAQEVSTLAPSTGAVDLITNKRTISTRVMVPDGAVLVLGGLISDDLQEGREEGPGAGTHPAAGRTVPLSQLKQGQAQPDGIHPPADSARRSPDERRDPLEVHPHT